MAAKQHHHPGHGRSVALVTSARTPSAVPNETLVATFVHMLKQARIVENIGVPRPRVAASCEPGSARRSDDGEVTVIPPAHVMVPRLPVRRDGATGRAAYV